MEKLIKLNLVKRIKRTEDVESFRFESNNPVNFIPGQFTQIIFDSDNLANKELNKYLSFSSSPTKPYLEFTKRLTGSKFSDKLKSLVLGQEINIKPAMGSCVFKSDYKNLAFLIGGIGITPVISIIEYVSDKQSAHDIVLLYSNRTPEIAFRKELDQWQSSFENIKVNYFVTDCETKDDQCIIGAIDEAAIREKVKNWPERFFFIFGPPAMVEAIKNICLKVGCDKSTIKTEKFIGY